MREGREVGVATHVCLEERERGVRERERERGERERVRVREREGGGKRGRKRGGEREKEKGERERERGGGGKRCESVIERETISNYFLLGGPNMVHSASCSDLSISSHRSLYFSSCSETQC